MTVIVLSDLYLGTADRFRHMNWCWLRFFALWAGLTGGSVQGQPIMIGYTNTLAVTNYSQPLMNQIGQLRWYFAHASVGDCMKLGLGHLHLANPNFYQFQSVSVTGTPAATNLAGGVYEYMRGNPGWQAKCDNFQTYVSNGWHYPLVNIAMNKLCFVDSTVSLSYYLKSMTSLEASFPQTVFVYTTLPLTSTNTSWDNCQNYNNYLRNVYNDGLRAWVATNNRVLFDIADIEAHDTNGALCYFIYRNRLCQRLFNGYTTDGGHPNSPYAEQLLGRGFYALAAALTTQSAITAEQFSSQTSGIHAIPVNNPAAMKSSQNRSEHLH